MDIYGWYASNQMAVHHLVGMGRVWAEGAVLGRTHSCACDIMYIAMISIHPGTRPDTVIAEKTTINGYYLTLINWHEL